MCQLRVCCCLVPLRNGCILAGIYEFVIVILDSLVCYDWYDNFREDERATWVIKMCLVSMCAILLLFGACKEDRVCVILHCVFLPLALLAEAISALVYNLDMFERYPAWLSTYIIVTHVFMIYIIMVGASYAADLKGPGHGDQEYDPRRPHRLMSSTMSSSMYGI